ncbi:hypothetical protein BMI91_16985 [Thioclava sediminum]|uniref:Uncharacterized protein n=1 Tax=Thioclava sediminum TaxID=1915319 RepID=A0ABX3MTX5_9RHOB|nr:hypothetical protein [Thioclava sediminum]OOY23137.1 hypothetical protein BMI91_16985 [Thioclava sediminum]
MPMDFQLKSPSYAADAGTKTEIGRRSLLLALAAGATAAAAMKGSKAEAQTQEDPELLTLADALPVLERDYLEALATRQDIVDRFAPTWPRAPQQIYRYGNQCTEERGVDGLAFAHPEDSKSGVPGALISVGKPEHFEADIRYNKERIAHIMKTKSKRGLKFHETWVARSEEALPLAKTYWADLEKAKSASGIDDANGRLAAVREALHAHVDQIMRFQEKTMQGLVIKAQAMTAWGKVEPFQRAFNIQANDWADAMAATVMRQAQLSA